MPVTAATDSVLLVLRELFERLHAEGIRYCHWKSNEHLPAAMTGATDVDVLIDRQAAQRLRRILTDTTDFKQFVVKAGRGYPGIEDYVGFDRRTGTLTHLHLHYQLTLGEKFLKGHRLPWEATMLDTRVHEEAFGVYVADPHLELLILVARAAIKLRARDYGLAAVGRRYFGGSLLREFRWLAARIDADRLIEVATPLVGNEAARQLLPMIAGPGPSIGQLLAFQRSARPRLHEYRMYSLLDTVRRMWIREATWIWWRGKHALLRAPTKSTRTLPQGGLSFAFLGGPSAETSTVTAACAKWLAREVAVVLVARERGSGSDRRMRRARSLGMVALSDGPLSGFLPDVTIRFRSARDGRVPDHSALSTGARVIEIDASGTGEHVLLQAKQAVWECL